MKILVYHIGSLGDTLIAVPALWAIRENFPNAHITMLTDKPPDRVLVQPSEILDSTGLIDDYVFYPSNRLLPMARLLCQLRFRKYDYLVYLIRAFAGESRIRRDKYFFRLSGITKFIGFEGFSENPTRLSNPTFEFSHMADILLERLRTDGLKTPNIGQGKVEINIGEQEKENVKKWLSKLPNDTGRHWLAIGPGSKMPCKVWPYERYLKVLKCMVEEYDLWPVIFGGMEDREIGLNLTRELERGYVAAGVLNVRDSMGAMQQCKFYLGNDTGTMHMAVASGLRCIGIFSSRNLPGLWYPYGDGHVVLRTPIACEGCFLEECIDNKMECILSISVDHVIDACRKLMQYSHKSI